MTAICPTPTEAAALEAGRRRNGDAWASHVDRRSTTTIVASIVALLLIVGCGSAAPAASSLSGAAATSTPASTPAPTRSATTAASVDPNVVARSFDIGNGRTLYLACAGSGSPTILLEAGDESAISQWQLVMPALIRETRTCAYERAGIGRSVKAEGCRELDDLLGDLDALLKVAEIPGPYVLVGTSGGGFLMAGLAARHPADVAGLVLVETPKAITILSPELKDLIRCDAPTNIERRDYAKVEHAVWDNRARIGDFPMTIISNDYGAAALPNDDQQTNVPDQKGWLVLSPKSKQIVVTRGHNVPGDQPALVIQEVLAILDVARHR